MARLNNMMDINVSADTTKETLIEALETLIEMVQEDVLDDDEVEVLDKVINFIAEDLDGEEALNEKRMSSAAKMQAKKYRLKNKAKLNIIAKKKKKCSVKIIGKEDKLACNSKGQVKRIDKARSRASKKGARSRA